MLLPASSSPEDRAQPARDNSRASGAQFLALERARLSMRDLGVKRGHARKSKAHSLAGSGLSGQLDQGAQATGGRTPTADAGQQQHVGWVGHVMSPMTMPRGDVVVNATT
ncbi:hypothetical protein GCM10012319_37600 [Comamonas sp. KCTC 72670]|nr:hypothetical protein GCM10012319_37600 [Comamonas sp. KCTC 72670]